MDSYLKVMSMVIAGVLIFQPTTLLHFSNPVINEGHKLSSFMEGNRQVGFNLPIIKINNDTIRLLAEKLGKYGEMVGSTLRDEIMKEGGELNLYPLEDPMDDVMGFPLKLNGLPRNYTGEPFVATLDGKFLMYLRDFEDGLEDSSMGFSLSLPENGLAEHTSVLCPDPKIPYREEDKCIMPPYRIELCTSVDSIEFPAMELGVEKKFNESLLIEKLLRKVEDAIEVFEPYAYATFRIWYEIDGGQPNLIIENLTDGEMDLPFEISVNYSIEGEEFGAPYPKANYPWISVTPMTGSAGIKLENGTSVKWVKVLVKINISGLDPGSYLAYLDIKPSKNISIPLKLRRLFEAHVEKRIPVRVTVWPSRSSNHSVRFEVLGYGEGVQTCDVGSVDLKFVPSTNNTYYEQISVFSLLVRLKDYGRKGGSCNYWIHSYSMLPVKVVEPDEIWGVKVRYIYRPFSVNKVIPLPDMGAVSGNDSFIRVIVEPVKRIKRKAFDEAIQEIDPRTSGEILERINQVLLKIIGDPRKPRVIHIPIHIFCEGKEIIYRFKIRYRVGSIGLRPSDSIEEDLTPFKNPYLRPSFKIMPLPSIGGPKVVRQGEKAIFGFVCWNPAVPIIQLESEPPGYEHPYCRSAVADAKMIKMQRVSYLLTSSLVVKPPYANSPYLMGIKYAPGIPVPNSGTLMPGGTPGGESVIYTILQAGSHTQFFAGVGDKPGRMFHLLVVDTTNLEPGNYICPVGYIALMRFPIGGFKGFAICCPLAIGFNLTVLPREANHTTYQEKVTPRSHDMESGNVFTGTFINRRLNAKVFKIEKEGNEVTGYGEKPLIFLPRGNLYKSFGRPPYIGGYLSGGHIVVGDRSSMFDLYPKRPVEIWKGLVGNESIAIPRVENTLPYLFSGAYDPGLERWRTPIIYRLYHTLGLINYHVVRLNPPPPFETLKLRILDPVSGEWPDEIPPTCHWTGQGIPPINEKDALGWLHRRYPRYGEWVSRLEGVANHSRVRMKLEIDLEQFGQAYGLCGDIGPCVHPPFLLKCSLPGIEICSVESRFGAWYCMHSPTADRSVCRFSWSSSSDCLEGSLTVNNEELKIYIPREWLAPFPPPWAANKSKPVSYVIPATGGRGDFRVPVGGGKWMTFPGPPYYPNFPLVRGVSDITTLSITFNGTIKKVSLELVCEASLILPANEENLYGRGNLPLQVSNWSEEVEDRGDWIRVGKSDVRISVRESNQPPRVELLYPKDHQTDVPIMLRQLAIKVYDPDNDKLSVSFYWASKDCIQIEPEEKKYYFTRSETSVHPSATFPYSYEWMTKRYLIQTKYNVTSGSVVVVDPRPVVYKFLGREWGCHKSITDAVIKGLEFGKEYQWYVVVRDRSTEIKSPIYHFRTANSKPDVRIRVFPERPVITNNTALWVYYKPFLLKNAGTLYEPVTKWFNRSVWVHLSIDAHDPEGLIRCVDHWRMKSSSWYYGRKEKPTPIIIGRDGFLPLPYHFELANKSVLALFTGSGVYTIRCSVYYDRYVDAYVPSTWKGYKLCDPEISFSILDGNHDISADFNCSTLKPKVGEQIVLDGSLSNVSGDIVEHRWFKIVYRIEAEFCKPERYARSIGKGEILSYEWDEPPGVQHIPAVVKKINYFQIVHVVENHAGIGTSLTKQVYPEEAKVVDNSSRIPRTSHGEEKKAGREKSRQVISGNAEVSIIQPLEYMLYFRNRPICRFFFTLVIGPIDIKVETKGSFSQLKIFVDGKEKAYLSYQEGKSIYSYRLGERGISKKAIRVVLYGNSGEMIKEDSVSFFFVNLGMRRN